MTWRCDGLHECRRISIRSVVAVVMLGIDLGVATLSEGRASSGQWIPREDECPRGRWFLKRSVFRNSWTMFSGKRSAWRTLLSVFESFWWDRTRVLILVQIRNWPLQMLPPLLFLQAPVREWSRLIWLSLGKLRCYLYSDGTSQNTFSHSEHSLKSGVGERDNKLMIKIITSWWTRSCGRGISYLVDLTCRKIRDANWLSECGWNLNMRQIGCFIYK